MAKVTRSTSNSDAESPLQQRTAQIASKGTAREVYLKASSRIPGSRGCCHPARRLPSLGRGHRGTRAPPLPNPAGAGRRRRDEIHRRGARPLSERRCAGAGAEQDLSGFDGSQHWTVGDRRRGNTTYYNSMGRNTGRSITRGNTTTSMTRWVVRRGRSGGDPCGV